MSGARSGGLLIAAFCTVFALIASSVATARSVRILGEEERAQIFGGQTIFCIYTNYSCPDWYYESSCTWDDTAQECNYCSMNGTSWMNCGTTTQQGYTCQATYGPNSPYCGLVFFETTMNQNCPGNCPSRDGNCGSQIPTVTGQTCPGGLPGGGN